MQMVTASRALVLDDASRYLAAESADGVTLTVPAQASVTWPANVEIHIQQIGAGQVTISPATGVEIISEETLKTRKQGSPSRSSGWVKTSGPCWVRWRQRDDSGGCGGWSRAGIRHRWR
ncbi:hypothetical protein ULF88_03185 [Halopseudomonas pachastrellae]|nr:hypothetical protein [Halopseudomonas pachastrellae]